MSKRRNAFERKDFLDHIREAVTRIETYSKDLTYEQFLESTRDQDAVVRNFEIIGEASRSIEKHFPDFVSNHPELPIRSASDMRNALSHRYFGVDLEIVWRTVQNDLPLTGPAYTKRDRST
jgi:uncharacterized protein with HEPN domain